MAQIGTQSIPQEQFLVMSVNLLHRAFVEAPRTDAKNLYRELAEGKRVALTNVKMDDGGLLRFDLALDYSEYEGDLNYSAFRASVATLLHNLVAALQEDKPVPTFNSQDDSNNMIFGITGVTAEKGIPAVMVLSSEIAAAEASVLLRLMYLDYQQFQRSQEGVGSA